MTRRNGLINLLCFTFWGHLSWDASGAFSGCFKPRTCNFAFILNAPMRSWLTDVRWRRLVPLIRSEPPELNWVQLTRMNWDWQHLGGHRLQWMNLESFNHKKKRRRPTKYHESFPELDTRLVSTQNINLKQCERHSNSTSFASSILRQGHLWVSNLAVTSNTAHRLDRCCHHKNQGW